MKCGVEALFAEHSTGALIAYDPNSTAVFSGLDQAHDLFPVIGFPGLAVSVPHLESNH